MTLDEPLGFSEMAYIISPNSSVKPLYIMRKIVIYYQQPSIIIYYHQPVIITIIYHRFKTLSSTMQFWGYIVFGETSPGWMHQLFKMPRTSGTTSSMSLTRSKLRTVRTWKQAAMEGNWIRLAELWCLLWWFFPVFCYVLLWWIGNNHHNTGKIRCLF